MDSSKQDDTQLSSPESTRSSTYANIPPSSYLTVPSTRPSGTSFSLPGPSSLDEDESDLRLPSASISPSDSIPQIFEPFAVNTPTERYPPSSVPTERSESPIGRAYMSVYSTSSADSERSIYSNPPARPYRVPSFQNMASRRITLAEKDQMIQALNSHQINTLVELRRIEKALATLGSPDVAAPMTAAWSYYVNSHSLLTELRGLTTNYPFSSECLEEAKRRVYSDPQSNRSWNFCWLVLSKVQNDQLIPYYAQYQAAQPAMWGGRSPSPEGVAQLTKAFVAEWNWAIDQMLRHWNQPPTR